MEMDLQLEKLGQLLQVLSVYFGEIAKNQLKFVLHRKNHLIFSSRCSTKNFMEEKKFFVRCLSSFDQNTAYIRDNTPLSALFVSQ